eukprot:767335-Hanusia_phi.AAC.6
MMQCLQADEAADLAGDERNVALKLRREALRSSDEERFLQGSSTSAALLKFYAVKSKSRIVCKECKIVDSPGERLPGAAGGEGGPCLSSVYHPSASSPTLSTEQLLHTVTNIACMPPWPGLAPPHPPIAPITSPVPS